MNIRFASRARAGVCGVCREPQHATRGARVVASAAAAADRAAAAVCRHVRSHAPLLPAVVRRAAREGERGAARRARQQRRQPRALWYKDSVFGVNVFFVVEDS